MSGPPLAAACCQAPAQVLNSFHIRECINVVTSNMFTSCSAFLRDRGLASQMVGGSSKTVLPLSSIKKKGQRPVEALPTEPDLLLAVSLPHFGDNFCHYPDVQLETGFHL